MRPIRTSEQLEEYLADERDWREANGMTGEELDEWRRQAEREGD